MPDTLSLRVYYGQDEQEFVNGVHITNIFNVTKICFS